MGEAATESVSERQAPSSAAAPGEALTPVSSRSEALHAAAEGQSAEMLAAQAEVPVDVGAIRGGGEPLQEEARATLEARFGADFSGVRVHTEAHLAEALGATGALAFAFENHVVFAPGAYRPGTREGLALLAHELTHVLQGQPGAAGAVAFSGPGPHEAEADRIGQLTYRMGTASQAPHLHGQADTGDLAGRLPSAGRAEGAAAALGRPAPGYEVQQRAESGRAHRCISGCTPTQAPQTLIDYLRTALAAASRPTHTALMTRIHSAPVAERQAVLQDAGVRGLITTHYAAAEATTLMSALMEGSQQWRNPIDATGLNDFYTYFVVNNGTGVLPNTATMNCWESIFYAAYLAGRVSAGWIRTFYQTALTGGGDPNVRVWANLGFTAALPRHNPGAGQQPTNGQLVFYKDAAAAYPGHVAIAISGTEAISLWSQPNNVNAVQRIRITDLAGEIYYGNPPW